MAIKWKGWQCLRIVYNVWYYIIFLLIFSRTISTSCDLVVHIYSPAFELWKVNFIISLNKFYHCISNNHKNGMFMFFAETSIIFFNSCLQLPGNTTLMINDYFSFVLYFELSFLHNLENNWIEFISKFVLS